MSIVFRAYVFDEKDHIIKAHVIEAETDYDAFAQAQVLIDGHDVEVWDGARLVARRAQSEKCRVPVSKRGGFLKKFWFRDVLDRHSPSIMPCRHRRTRSTARTEARPQVTHWSSC
jgi:hypothetical protein